MLNRRRFLQCLTIAAASPATSIHARANDATFGPLHADPLGLLDLPRGFTHHVVSRAGNTMADGFKVPGAHDGMASFAGENGRIILVCNHENASIRGERSAFGSDFESVPDDLKRKFYDRGNDVTPGLGGTTTTIFNPVSGETERQHLSLAGTEINCAGGRTPWDTWLSCEECFEVPGRGLYEGQVIQREKAHGYVFEVPARATGLTVPHPIKTMGKFAHEAAAVHESSGIVFMTEDMHESLLYRYIPDVPGQLLEGGRLQALAVRMKTSFDSRNWGDELAIGMDDRLQTYWVDLDDVDGARNDLRLRGAARGAAIFARGEGLCIAGDEIAFSCTIGGPERLGQVFAYRPSPHEGREEESNIPGQLRLVAEANQHSVLRNADNLTMAPWGDLIVCEDTSEHCGLVGIRPDGGQYQIADNAHSDSELAGVCFSPDGKTLFANIQYPGMTLAITGPWPA
jgi:secreted PhoX family phosphatase